MASAPGSLREQYSILLRVSLQKIQKSFKESPSLSLEIEEKERPPGKNSAGNGGKNFICKFLKVGLPSFYLVWRL